MYKIHDGCFFDLEDLCAVWSEKYSDPKLDANCYLVRALFKNNSTILTLASFPSKKQADNSVNKLHKSFK
jgi:hypothetical protein